MSSYNLQIRLNQHEADAFFQAAAKQGMELTTWVRWVCTKAAAESLAVPIDQLVPRQPPGVVKVRSPNPATPTNNPNVKVSKPGLGTVIPRTRKAK